MYFLGLDGGGTKTTVVLVNEEGYLLSKYIAGPSNPMATPIEDINTTWNQLFSRVRSEHPEAFKQIRSVCAGVAGTENTAFQASLYQILKDAFPSEVIIKLYHDAITALYSGTGGAPGIVNIAGTGSITFGLTPNGDKVRTGGWGYLLDHAGSGYGIGRLAIQRMFEDYDGLIPTTKLTKRILERFSIEKPPAIIPYLYQLDNWRTRIASICEDVFEVVEEGDPIAQQIITRAVSDMARNINSLLEQHFVFESSVNVVLAGSVFKRKKVLLPLLKDALHTKTRFILPQSPPVVGSVIAGYQSVLYSCPESFKSTLHRSYSEED